MKISLTEFRKNVDKYLLKSQKEEIYITKYNRITYKLSPISRDPSLIVESLIGIIPSTVRDEEGRDERLKKHLL